MTGLLVIGGVISWCVIAFHEEVYATTQASPQWLKQLLSTEVAYHIDTAETHVTTPVQHAAAVVTDRVGLFGQTRPSPQVAGEQRSPATAVSGTASPLQYSGGITEAELEERLQQFATELPLAKQQLTQDTLRTLLQTTGRILGALQDRSVGGDRFIRQVERI
ncbi:MAG TPA: hypothetical protein VKP88_03590, partial [Candidatus Paceibacterota bacterium]|nr:hypothetical protein [Candidatus Paceibacterota bacterium]